MDIMLNDSGDMVITPNGDIRLVDSVAQKVRIRLLWLLGEWRWDEEEGLPYREELLMKNPRIQNFIGSARRKLLEIDKISGVRELKIDYDRATRKGKLICVAISEQEIIKEEVALNWPNTE